MTATVRAGERGVDFSFARPPAARLVELGYTFVVGYISVPPASPNKNITKAQCEDYIAAGLKVLLVWEMTQTRASYGSVYGIMDGQWAKAQAAARGYPQDVPILVADDTNTITTNTVKQQAYMQAFAAECAPYQIGIYGDTDILAACAPLWRIGWLPNAWSWSGASRADAEAKAKAIGAHVLQHTGFWIDQTWAVDPNTAIADFPAWGHSDPPSPIPGDTDMADTYFSVESLPGEYLLRAGRDPVPFASAADRDALVKGMGLVSAGVITLEQYNRLFAPKPDPITVTMPLPPTMPPPFPTKFSGTLS